MKWQTLFGLGLAMAALAIASGAFGAHALSKRLAPDMLAVYEVGARYHMYGALAVTAIALAAPLGVRALGAGWMVGGGTLVFAGTLYALALTGTRWLGAITPIGGTLMLAGLGWAAVRALLTRS